ncbi:MAG: hypothetical protein ACOYJQ_08610 [Pseudochelatococcus sp.]|uniref:hypothetical protein n=1 Tax=Pseudochelatococcus sp. TaxID=2020869 RepID=UPI003D8E4660
MTDKSTSRTENGHESEVAPATENGAPELDRREAAKIMLNMAAATPIVALLFDPASARAAATAGGVED